MYEFDYFAAVIFSVIFKEQQNSLYFSVTRAKMYFSCIRVFYGYLYVQKPVFKYVAVVFSKYT